MYEALFARFLIIGQQRNIQLLSVFRYEFSPVPCVPHSLVDDLGYLLKGDLSPFSRYVNTVAGTVINISIRLVMNGRHGGRTYGQTDGGKTLSARQRINIRSEVIFFGSDLNTSLILATFL